MKRILLITTAINPKVLDAVKNISEESRIEQLNKSLINTLEYLNDLSLIVYIIDGTGYDLRNKIYPLILSKYNINIDYCVPCEKNTTKSTAESYLLLFWYKKYRFKIGAEDLIMKITGRYTISNLKKISKALPKEFFFKASLEKGNNLVQTVFFRIKFSRFQGLIKYLQMHANNNEAFEKTVGDYVEKQTKFYSRKVAMPIYYAQSGTSGKKHQLNLRYRLMQVISKFHKLCIELV